MFRAQAVSPFDDVVAKATDENLTSEDWSAILEVCDKVSSDGSGPKEAVQSMIKRLAHRNANVQLYTLELAHALCQNCGKPMHREVSSRAFTDALLKLANDRNTHAQVKAKILEKMQEWTEMFSGDAELGIMNEAYMRLKQSNPTLQAPNAPQKQGLTDADRRKEEDELQMALRLSLQEEERKKKSPAAGPSKASGAGSGGGTGELPAETPVPAGTTAATVSRVRALYDFVPSEAGELEFKRGDVIAVLESVYKDWWRGSLKGKTGIFPLNYVEKLTDPTPDELQREAQMEAEVFAEIKNVEKLLTLLSASNTTPREEDNEEISKLYHQTLAIRPKLIKLIEKYSQKKDDFTQLNEKFIKARRDYEALLESSMSHPPQHNYQQYAIRPGPGPGPGPGGYPPPPSGYAPPQDAGYYNQTPPPAAANYPPQQGTPAPSGAPFYVGGSEVPSHAAPPQHDAPPPPQQSPPPPQNYAAPFHQQQQHAPPPPQPQQQQQQNQRPQSTYGAQELATSVYDSPIAPQNPHAGPFAPHQQQQQNAYPGAPHSSMSPPPALQPGAPPQQPQYKPYVPPGSAADGQSPNDYYRQGSY